MAGICVYIFSIRICPVDIDQIFCSKAEYIFSPNSFNMRRMAYSYDDNHILLIPRELFNNTCMHTITFDHWIKAETKGKPKNFDKVKIRLKYNYINGKLTKEQIGCTSTISGSYTFIHKI